MTDTSCLTLFPLTGISESEQFLKGTSQIKILCPEDIEGMRVVCKVTTQTVMVVMVYIFSFIFHACCCLLQLAREVLDIAAEMVKIGVTTEEIDHTVHLVQKHTNTSFLLFFISLLQVLTSRYQCLHLVSFILPHLNI